MSARVERYRLDEEEGNNTPSIPGPTIKLPLRPPGTSSPVPDIPDSLLDHLQTQFPNTPPERAAGMTADDALLALGIAWGRREVIAYLERIHKQQQG